MKLLTSLLVGMLVGAAVFLLFLYFNPFTTGNKLSPLSVSDNDLINLNYSAVAADALMYTNDGESQVCTTPGQGIATLGAADPAYRCAGHPTFR